jgi:hypothetical protein
MCNYCKIFRFNDINKKFELEKNFVFDIMRQRYKGISNAVFINHEGLFYFKKSIQNFDKNENHIFLLQI